MAIQELVPAVMAEDEFVEWCDEDTRAEYVDGEVILMSPESGESEDTRWFVGGALVEFVKMRRLGLVRGPNFQVRLRAGLRRVPDILFVATERLNLVKPNHLEGAPDLALEIVSADSVARDREEKFREYAAAGVREYWVVDPLQRSLEVYSLNEAGQYEPVSSEGGAFHSGVVPGFWLRPEWLWEQPTPSGLDLLRRIGALA